MGLQSITMVLQSITIVLQPITISLQSMTMVLQLITIVLQSITMGLQSITIGLQSMTMDLQLITKDLFTSIIVLQRFTIATLCAQLQTQGKYHRFFWVLPMIVLQSCALLLESVHSPSQAHLGDQMLLT